MSEANKNRLEVQQIIRDGILGFIANYRLGDWDAMEFAQASFQKADSIILLNRVGSRRLGWQSTRNPVVEDELKRVDEWIELQSWQIHVIRKRKIEDDANSILAEDMASDLIAWFNGAGCDYLRRHGCACERIDADSVIVYNDDSELYQKRAVFTVKIQVPKELTAGEIEMDSVVPKIKPI